jgi:hypothetical protein
MPGKERPAPRATAGRPKGKGYYTTISITEPQLKRNQFAEFRSPAEIDNDLVALCRQARACLTDWEKRFCASLEGQLRLSRRQQAVLGDISLKAARYLGLSRPDAPIGGDQ